MSEKPEEIARKVADDFAAHEMNTPFFASTRPYFERIVATAIKEAYERAAVIASDEISPESARRIRALITNPDAANQENGK